MSNLSKKNIAELLGTIGVIASLIFVGLEIRQNSAIARAEVQRSFADSIISVTSLVIEHPDLRTLLWRVANESTLPADLTDDEVSLLNNYYGTVLFAWDAHYASLEAGLIDEEDIVFLDSYLNNTFFIEQWPVMQGLASPEFRRYLEENHLDL